MPIKGSCASAARQAFLAACEFRVYLDDELEHAETAAASDLALGISGSFESVYKACKAAAGYVD